MQEPASPAAPVDALPQELRDRVLPPLDRGQVARVRRRVRLLLAAVLLVLLALHLLGRIALRPDRIAADAVPWKAYAGTVRAERTFQSLAAGCRAASEDPARAPPAVEAPWNPYAGYLGAAWHVQRWAHRAGLDLVAMPPGDAEVLELADEIGRIRKGTSRADLRLALEDVARLQLDAAAWAVEVRARLVRAHPFLEDADGDAR